MNVIDRDEIDALQCVACQGIWFREGTHEKARHSRVIDVATDAGRTSSAAVRDVQCPECHQKMIRMIDRQQHHIHYESCPYCYGVFFDAGEFRDYTEYSLLERMKEAFITLRNNLRHS